MPGNRTVTRWLRLGCKCQFHVRSSLYSSMTSVIASSLCMRMAWNERWPIPVLIYRAPPLKIHLKAPPDDHMAALCFMRYEIAHFIVYFFLDVCVVPQQPGRLGSFLHPLRAASLWDLGDAKKCHNHDACPMWHSVSVSHSGMQYSGFPLHWLQKYRWAHSRWTCHSQHLQDPNSQRGKTEGQRKFCCEEFCRATWDARGWRWNNNVVLKTHAEKDKVVQNVTIACDWFWQIRSYIWEHAIDYWDDFEAFLVILIWKRNVK